MAQHGSGNPTVDDQLYELHASICQVLANPTRLKVLNALREGEVAVTELAGRVGTSVPNLSRHLATLKARRVVVARRDGVTVYYRLTNPKTLRACDIMREVLLELLAEGQRLYVASRAVSRQGVERRGGEP
jgi:ArsR family transcriptional regulator